MQRYFAKEKKGNTFIIYDSDIHHIKNVMRYKENDQIEVCYEGDLYICTINSINPLSLKIDNKIKEDRKLKVELTVAVSLVSEQKFDLILQKLTELGVSTIIPLKTTRSIIKLDDKKSAKKIERWQMICKEASEQSKRTDIPIVTQIKSIKELNDFESQIKLICSLNENTQSIGNYLDKNIKNILFVIGPEGGLTEQEEAYLLEHKFLPVTLGKRVLRVETATIYVASIINYVYGG